MDRTSSIATPVTDIDGNAADRYAPVARGDKHIWGIYIFLCLISVIELYSASSREVAGAGLGVYGTIVRHGAMLLAGFGLIYFLQRTHYKKFLSWGLWFAIASIIMMIYTIFNGEYINGARRSFRLLFVSIQPSEFLKLSSAVVLAFIMSRTQIKGGGLSNIGIACAAGVVLLFGAMLAPQGLTNTILLMCISLSMMIIGGISWKKFGIVLVVYGACFGAYLLVTHLRESSREQTEMVDDEGEETVRKSRLGVWVDRLSSYVGTGRPKYEEPLTSSNRQEMLGYMAQANGGVIGVLPGNSRETSRLPLAFTDYIYSIVVEETGLIGGLFVLVLYLWLLARAFPALLVIGMALVIVFQALFHICIVTGVIPVSGQPLPLISKGGSSILVTSIAFGVMLSVSRFAVRTNAKKKEIRQEIDALPEEMRADNPTQL